MNSNKLATIQQISSVEIHPNADSLEIAKVKGYQAIVKKGQWKAGDSCIFIAPDAVLPDAPWTSMYKSKSSRVRAIKLRNVWSEGIIESFSTVGYNGAIENGLDITEAIGVYKYDPPVPQDMSAKGALPYSICKTDEERFNSIDDLPFGELVDVTLKIDGQSASYYWLIDDNGDEKYGSLGRTLEYKSDSFNNYTQNQANYDIFNKLSYFCRQHNFPQGICVRGESYGKNIQKSSHNPSSGGNLSWAMFSVWLIRQQSYARKGHQFYFLDIADELRLPTVPILERNVPLTKELIMKYAEGIETLPLLSGGINTLSGKPFEGVVIQHSKGSFKVINKHYDSKK
jgi:RNA ligase (TIGR02306 family)